MSSKIPDNHDKQNTPKHKRKKDKKVKNQSDDDGDDGEKEFNNEQFQEMLAGMFPSKHQKDKVQDIKKKKEVKSKKKKEVKKKKKKKKKIIKEESSEEEYNPEDDAPTTSDSELDRIFEEELGRMDDEEDEELDTEDEEELEEMRKGFQGMKFNIIFTDPRGGMKPYDEDYDDDEWVDEEEDEDDEEDEELENIKMTKKEYELHKKEETKSLKEKSKGGEFKKNERIHIKLDDWDRKYIGIIKKVYKNKKGNKYDVQLDESDDDEEYELVRRVRESKITKINKTEEKEKYEYNKLLNEMKELIRAKDKGTTAFEKKFNEMQKIANEEEKKDKAKNIKIKKQKNFKSFRKLLRGKREVSDIKYFKSLDIDAQENIMKKMKEVQEYSNEEKPHKFKLIESSIPVQYKSMAMRKLDSLQWMDPGSGEYYKIKQWVDNFMKIPFGKHSSLPVSLEDGEEKYQAFMENAKTVLDEAVYGLDDAKMQIMQLVGQWIANPKSMGKAIAIKGPMGTGKTTLVKEGVSKILNRPFSFVALGGATDSSFLEGHSYTYEGSIWGRIVDTLINCGSMNPVFYFDELDKVSQTPKGEEIIGILTHLTDTSQNDKYHDKYFSNIDFDLSKALFIFSYNDESKVNPILRDRMYRISTQGYKKDQKDIIAQKYLIPKIIKEVNFNKDEIIIPRETVEYICDHLVEEEKGVRNLKRALEIIYTKINLFRLIPKDSKLFDNEKHIEVKFPFTVTPDIVKNIVKKSDKQNPIPYGMFV
jgi:ATP-dependent Lon protease